MKTGFTARVRGIVGAYRKLCNKIERVLSDYCSSRLLRALSDQVVSENVYYTISHSPTGNLNASDVGSMLYIHSVISTCHRILNPRSRFVGSTRAEDLRNLLVARVERLGTALERPSPPSHLVAVAEDRFMEDGRALLSFFFTVSRKVTDRSSRGARSMWPACSFPHSAK